MTYSHNNDNHYIWLWRYVIVMRERNVMMIAPMVATEYCVNTMMM